MADDFWSRVTGGRLHTGSWFGLPDFGATEVLAAERTSEGGSNLIGNNNAQTQPKITGEIPDTGTKVDPNADKLKGTVLGTKVDPNADKLKGTVLGTKTTTTTPTGGGNGGNGGNGGSSDGGYTIDQIVDAMMSKGYNNRDQAKAVASADPARFAREYLGGSGGSDGGVDDLARQQEEAAKKAAEAKRVAAQNRYDAAVRQGTVAKGQAKDQYDWLVDTLGSNKKDTLEKITLNETEGMEAYQAQEEMTKTQYSKAKQEILSTYRDLNTQQEKIMRGTGGMANSSRSQEAAIKLNNLMGKDLSTITTNEADSIGAIGKAVTSLKTKILQSKNDTENSTKQQLDQAAMDYNAKIAAIDENTNLAEDAKEEAYLAAEAELADATASINTWAAQTKTQNEQQERLLKAQLDALVLDLTDEKGGLNSTLQEKLAKTNDYITAAGYTKLDTESALSDNKVGVKNTKKYTSKAELDAALAKGEISQDQYSTYLSGMGSSTGPAYSTSMPAGTRTNNAMAGVMNDPLLKQLLGGSIA